MKKLLAIVLVMSVLLSMTGCMGLLLGPDPLPTDPEPTDGPTEPEAEEPYFEKKGWYANYTLDEGGTYMDNCVYAYTKDGEFYARLPATVTITRDSYYDTLDGYVEMEFTKLVYVDKGDYPMFMFENKFTIGMIQNLYDYHTGYWLPDTRTYGDSNRGENYFYYEYESQGRQVHVEFNYSTDWERHEDDSYTLTMDFFIRMPADYDGIAIAQVEVYPDYESMMNRSDPGEELRPPEGHLLKNALICLVNTFG